MEKASKSRNYPIWLARVFTGTKGKLTRAIPIEIAGTEGKAAGKAPGDSALFSQTIRKNMQAQKQFYNRR